LNLVQLKPEQLRLRQLDVTLGQLNRRRQEIEQNFGESGQHLVDRALRGIFGAPDRVQLQQELAAITTHMPALTEEKTRFTAPATPPDKPLTIDLYDKEADRATKQAAEAVKRFQEALRSLTGVTA
jgi:hypothetical protein